MTSKLNTAVDTKIFIKEAPSQSADTSVFKAGSELSKASHLYERKDVVLAAANVATLAIPQIVQRLNPTLASSLTIPFFVMGIYQQYLTYKAIPDSAPITKTLAQPVLQLIGWPLLGLISPVAGKVLAAAQFVGIAQNSVPKLYSCWKNREEKTIDRIRAAALHVFNLVAQGSWTKDKWDTIDLLNEIKVNFETAWKEGNKQQNADWEKTHKEWDDFFKDWEKRYGSVFNAPECTTKPDSFFASMTPLERITSPELNPKCPADAVKILKVTIDPACETAVKNAHRFKTLSDRIKNACASTINAISTAFRRESFGIHPDKCPKAQKDIAEQAMQRIVEAKETLLKKYNPKLRPKLQEEQD